MVEVAGLLEGTGAIEAISDARRIYDAYLEQGETPYSLVQADFDITEGRAVTQGALAQLAASEGSANAWEKTKEVSGDAWNSVTGEEPVQAGEEPLPEVQEGGSGSAVQEASTATPAP